jgi:hydroxyacylglutathione hydrolase
MRIVVYTFLNRASGVCPEKGSSLFFRQVLYRDLGCASYMLGDAGEAAVVDPRWDIDVYLEIARTERLRITHVLDTHDHADHVSGRIRLAQATGARVYRPAGPDETREDRMHPGQVIAVGSLRLQAIATPGHRPEHLSLTVADRSRTSEPWLLLTGDSLLVGDLARPDLSYEAIEGARTLHSSLKHLLGLGDHVEVWPGHVGGSLCGGAGLSGKTSSTVGFERRHNPMLQMGEADFVSRLTSNLPSRPPNVDRIVALNQRGDGGHPAEPPPLKADRLRELLVAGVTVLDSRQPDEFDAGHLANAVNLPVSAPGVGTRAGWALESGAQIVIVAKDPDAAREMTSALQAVGLWELAGYTLAGESWERDGFPIVQAHSWNLDQLAHGLRRDSVELVDVRESSEWVCGHVVGSHHVPLRRLRDVTSVRIPDRGRTTAVVCAAGIRAAFAASLFRRAGRRDVVRVSDGGVGDLSVRGIPLAVGAD